MRTQDGLDLGILTVTEGGTSGHGLAFTPKGIEMIRATEEALKRNAKVFVFDRSCPNACSDYAAWLVGTWWTGDFAPEQMIDAIGNNFKNLGCPPKDIIFFIAGRKLPPEFINALGDNIPKFNLPKFEIDRTLTCFAGRLYCTTSNVIALGDNVHKFGLSGERLGITLRFLGPESTANIIKAIGENLEKFPVNNQEERGELITILGGRNFSSPEKVTTLANLMPIGIEGKALIKVIRKLISETPEKYSHLISKVSITNPNCAAAVTGREHGGKVSLHH